MAPSPDSTSPLRAELDETRRRLAEAEETLAAIRHGKVDGLAVAGPAGDHIFTLKSAQEPFRLLIEQMSEGALTLSPQGLILYANQAFARLLQTPLEQIIGAELQSFLGSAEPSALAGLLAAAWSGSCQGEVTIRTAAGAFLPVRLGLSRLQLGPETLLCVVATDLPEQRWKEEELGHLQADLERRVAERTADLAMSRLAALNMMEEAVESQKRAEQAEEELRQLNTELDQRVAERTAQLEASNQELEAFCYSISHDLRAPLRAIIGYSRILEQEHGASLGDEGRRVLGVVCSEGKRMGQLIDDLLAFSRLNRQAVRMEPIDMGELAQKVFEECAAAQAPGRQIEFKLTPLPPAHGDPALLRQVLANLFSNAIKYTRPRPVAQIELTTGVQDGEIYFSLQDNGVGFDMKYPGNLFGVFQRLHAEKEFEGTGVGLAIAQRVILRHGGRIWADARLNQGAAFSFTLPIRPSPSPS